MVHLTTGQCTFILLLCIVIATAITVPTVLKSKDVKPEPVPTVPICGFFTNKRCSPVIQTCGKEFVKQNNWGAFNMEINKSEKFTGHDMESMVKFCKNDEVCIGFLYSAFKNFGPASKFGD